MTKLLRKAVFPVAGLGTRFLPATKAVPKELLPVVDRPLIQYAVQEALEAGVDTLIFVVSPGKESILAHFEINPDLERTLAEGGKANLLAEIRKILPAGVTAHTVIQEKPLGLGHAVLCARELIDDDEFFAVLLPDDMVRNEGPGALQQLADVHVSTGSSVIGLEAIDPSMTGSYGIAEVSEGEKGLQRITSLVEKPSPEEAPSNLGIVGRYLLDGAIFDRLQSIGAGAGGEIQLTDGIAQFMVGSPVYACALAGVRYDCGSREGMLKANIDYALAQDELRGPLLDHLRKVLAQA